VFCAVVKRTAAAAATLAALALPGAAGAATIEVTASAGPSASEYILYRVSTGEHNRVQVLMKGNRLVLVDRGTKRIRPKRNAGFGLCRATSRQRVVCPRYPLFTSLRDGNDRLTIAPGAAGAGPSSTNPYSYAESYEDTEGAVTDTTWIDAGTGDDFVSGSRFNDVIVPGSGDDRVEGRGGPDLFIVKPDGRRDLLLGHGGLDTVAFDASESLLIDLAQGIGGPAGGIPDDLVSLERVHGGSGDDHLRGTNATDALYGERGKDSIDGRGGNDMLVGDSPLNSEPSPNELVGGDGDDVLDTRAEKPAPTSSDQCGPGTDSLLSGVDTLAAPDCELAVPRIVFGSSTSPADESLLRASPMRTVPVAKTADSVTFEVGCPALRERNHSGCGGSVILERPASGERLGSGPINLAAGQRGNVTVSLNAAGQAAVAGVDPIAVRLAMELQPPAGSQASPVRPFTGFQADL
jgi:hypothetical protein